MKIYLKKYLFFILINIGYSTIINIPADHATIQAGIDASNEGDTILVAQGDYYENLYLDKEIFSLAMQFMII